MIVALIPSILAPAGQPTYRIGRPYQDSSGNYVVVTEIGRVTGGFVIYDDHNGCSALLGDYVARVVKG
jgi:hypothetical protein